MLVYFFYTSRKRHTISYGDWSSDVCSSELAAAAVLIAGFVEKAPGGKVVLLVPGEREAEQFRSDLSFAATAGHSTALPVRLEIGRAACRGRAAVAVGYVVHEDQRGLAESAP